MNIPLYSYFLNFGKLIYLSKLTELMNKLLTFTHEMLTYLPKLSRRNILPLLLIMLTMSIKCETLGCPPEGFKKSLCEKLKESFSAPALAIPSFSEAPQKIFLDSSSFGPSFASDGHSLHLIVPDHSVNESKLAELQDASPRCVGSFFSGLCNADSSGNRDGAHRVVKPLVCGYEWCDHCGDFTHERRKARYRSRWNEMREEGSVGILVITVPREMAEAIQGGQVIGRTEDGEDIEAPPRPDLLRDLQQYWRRKIKSKDGLNWKKGFLRWHYRGDSACKKINKRPGTCCPGGVCPLEPDEELTGYKQCMLGDTFHPHLNIAAPARWLHGDLRKRLRTDYIAWLTEKGFGAKGAVIHYHYIKAHAHAKAEREYSYILRNTMKKDYYFLHKFRGISWFGKFKARQDKEAKPLCPECASSITWHGICPLSELRSGDPFFVLGLDNISSKRPGKGAVFDGT